MKTKTEVQNGKPHTGNSHITKITVEGVFLVVLACMCCVGCKRVQELKDSMNKANAASLSMKGRNLYVAIAQANMDREAVGKADVWPKSTLAEGADANDIASRLYDTSTDYFRALLDLQNRGQSAWHPYAGEDLDPAYVIDPKTGKSKWIVVKGDFSKLPDCAPVLVSANVDVASLLCKSGTYATKELTGNLRFTGNFAIVVSKCGAVHTIKAKYSQLRFVYISLTDEKFVIPEGLSYLVP